MTLFENELKNGVFVSSECRKCDKLVWPPSDFCNTCFSQVKWRQISNVAKLIEFSKNNEEIFCIAEFENSIRVIGSLDTKLEPFVGQELNLKKCYYADSKLKMIFEPL